MRSEYQYGERYDIDLVKPEDYKLLQAFSCGNEQLVYFIHSELIQNNEVDSEDGLAYKIFMRKMDVLAVDTQY